MTLTEEREALEKAVIIGIPSGIMARDAQEMRWRITEYLRQQLNEAGRQELDAIRGQES